MTIQELEIWLTEFLPEETACKDFYLKHHSITVENFLNIKDTISHKDLTDNPFLILDASYNPSTVTLEKYNKVSLFKDSTWFVNSNFEARKHPRYFPPAFFQTQFINVCYIVSGECTKTFRFAKNSESINLKSGDICIIPPMITQCNSVYQDSGIMLQFSVRQDTLRAILNNILPDSMLMPFFSSIANGEKISNYMVLSSGNDSQIHSAFLNMALEYCLQNQYWEKVCFFQLGLIFTYLQRNYMHTIRFSSTSSTVAGYIPEFLSYLQQHFHSFSLNNMADYFHLSPNYICNIYKKQIGKTITQTLQEIRTSHAQNLLQTTTLSIQQIGEIVGYEDTTYFIRMFKKQTGTTPLQYRKQCSSEINRHSIP